MTLIVAYGGQKESQIMYTLVIIDDEEKIVEGIAHLFPWEEIGFQVIQSFTNAPLALDFIMKNPVDVVLSDIEMPGMNGLQLCEALQAKEGIHIVFFSSYQNYEYFRSAIRLSVDDYLLKPINYPELLTCFARVKSRLDEEHKQVGRTCGSVFTDGYRKTCEETDGSGYAGIHFPYVIRRAFQGNQNCACKRKRGGRNGDVQRRRRDSSGGKRSRIQIHIRVCSQSVQRNG